ncbi:phage gp6-like head-tail connector protein [Actinoplanes sp. N902-109]|uniref:phage gp6-like head-tail connector protein n=1 Tax=Actinoplanes sp. (strain N902-109) TaxID=649831 RepID=UPI0003293478|nr:phage gp6-like head-tail connector protein [Actinoplanes sp. N902-109]AGL19503.1 hypothetical protein L083_5993 [Actinoplanes sp. N902-109]
MTYRVGEAVPLAASSTVQAGVSCTVTAPDGSINTPAATYGSGAWTAVFTPTQPGDYLYVFAGPGFVASDQFHVVATALHIVGLADVKQHANITTTANDRELLDFIGTAEAMVEDLVGPVVPRTITGERLEVRPGDKIAWLNQAPVLSIVSITRNGVTLDPGRYRLWPDTGQLDFDSPWPWSWLPDAAASYEAGRRPIPDGIRWAAKELVTHLWQSTQSQRGGRGRGDVEPAAAPFGMPNRVADALEPWLLAPGVH